MYIERYRDRGRRGEKGKIEENERPGEIERKRERERERRRRRKMYIYIYVCMCVCSRQGTEQAPYKLRTVIVSLLNYYIGSA